MDNEWMEAALPATTTEQTNNKQPIACERRIEDEWFFNLFTPGRFLQRVKWSGAKRGCQNRTITVSSAANPIVISI